MPEPGDFLGERYRIVNIHTGGMGEVFICEVVKNLESEMDRSHVPQRLALKTFQQRFFFNNAVRIAFIREATTWLRLSGLPHIMPMFGIEQIDDRPFLLMLALTPGPLGECSIADLLEQGPLHPEIVLKYAFQLTLALVTAVNRVEGLVHGDLKPANILLMNDEVYLADFGLVSAASLGRTDNRLESTWAYRAPELWTVEPWSFTVASDVYAIGILLYEMLVGHHPFLVDVYNRDTWAAAHRHKSLQMPAGYPTDGLPAVLMKLATACLEKKPSQRPKDFSEILARINTIYEEYDPVNHFILMMRAHEWKISMDTQFWYKARICGLIEMDEPQQALDELDAIESDEYDSELWLRRGTALSLVNRDEEALPCFERAHEGELSPSDQINCQVEYALSLKRLKRFDEAKAIYEQLITMVSDAQLPLVIVNLATIYLVQQKGEEAVLLLEPFVRRTPDSAHAWVNLGQAYVFVHRYEDAERAYGRALVLSPQEGRIRVMLAALYMDHLGRPEEAFMALEAAFGSGYESREWLVRMLTCSILFDRRDYIDGLFTALKENLGESLANSMLDEAQKMSEKLMKKYSSSQRYETKDTQDDRADLQNAISNSDAAIDTINVEPIQSDPASSPFMGQEDKCNRPRLPFLNFRFYDFHDFTLDFYQSPAITDFVNTFLTEWRRVTRDPQIAMVGGSLRGSPFYFTQCPNCGIHVLTNRDIGKQIRCRMCEERWQTDPLPGNHLGKIISEVSEAIGIQQASGESVVHALLIQAPDNIDGDIIRKICEQGG